MPERAGEALDHEAARDFVNAYIGAGGTVSASFGAESIQFIRRRLRWECRTALAERVAGLPFDEEYFNSEIEAFQRLRGLEL